MATKHHTIIVVPHARAKLRKWRVTNRQLALSLGLFAFATFAAFYIIWSFFTIPVDHRELQNLRRDNDNLRRVNEAFEGSIEDLRTQLAVYEERTRKLAIVAGLESFSQGNEAGIGGGEGLTLSSPELGAGAAGALHPEDNLETLGERAAALGSQLRRIETKLQERARWVAAMPAITPARGLFTSGFGMRRDPIHGRRAFHRGVDISAAPGAPVQAAADGLVIQASRMQGLGNAVYLSHGFGINTRYGHLSKISVEPGQRVQRGDIIGHVGNTGRSTGYHLHYEVFVDGKAVNPMAFILDR